eukprot:TRINITY_DN6933_c0_g1_i4.p1 TRINITY_DN6933_c0_g1~~TRINITY_DN6933_c0_g1_i4.p1  ORF type:complete len:461 (+),score=153.97 TRINITY_DN6933_c0_g1_i4:42-1385(+)
MGTELRLDGLVLFGATHTVTDAMYLSEAFLKNGVNTSVIAVPGSVDGNVHHSMLEGTVGFDSASKVYSQLIGNILIDSASSVKYWYFIRLMGRDPSHLVLESALQTQPNHVLISEEIASKGQTLDDVVREIADLVVLRSKHGKNFGTVLIPEGLLVHLPHVKSLIDELSKAFSALRTEKERNELAEALLKDQDILHKTLTAWSAAFYQALPDFTRKQLVFERESSGNVFLSKIETERLLAQLVGEELAKRKKSGEFKSSFAPITHFFGYQGRCSFPSTFDAELASAYGFTAGVLASAGVTGYCVTARGLTGPVDNWFCGGIPLVAMSHAKAKSAYGTNMAVIPSTEVDVNGAAFKELARLRDNWRLVDSYFNPGPIQFAGRLAQSRNRTLVLSQGNYLAELKRVNELIDQIKSECRFGVHEEIVQIAIMNLESLEKLIHVLRRNLNH